MKNSTKIISLFIGLCLTLVYFSCQKDSRSTYMVKYDKYKEIVEKAGTTHNEYLEELLTSITASKVNLKDTVAYRAIVEPLTKKFFRERGYNTSNLVMIPIAPNEHTIDISKLSSKSQLLINSLKNAYIRGKATGNTAQFFTQVERLKQAAIEMDNTETYTVATTMQIALSSMTYWKFNLKRWGDLLWDNNIKNEDKYGGSMARLDSKCKVNVWKVGGADASGAISGAIGGGLGGPLGAVAGATCVGAMGSLGNIGNQLMSCAFDWWPFLYSLPYVPIDIPKDSLVAWINRWSIEHPDWFVPDSISTATLNP